MKSLLIGAAALALAVPALAQVAPAPAQAPRAAKVHTRAEVQAKIAEHFAKVDANRDGFITKEEADAAHQAMRGAMRERFAKRSAEWRDGRAGGAFERLDSNKDGQLSRQEWDAGRQLREQRRAERGGEPRRGRMMGMGMGAPHGRMFEMADANKDGRVTLAEAQSAALRHFDMIDVNRDGQVTPDERRHMRQQRRSQRQAG